MLFGGSGLICLLLFWRFAIGAARLAKLEERTDYDFGDSLNFLPHLALFLLLSVVWSIKAYLDVSKHKDYQASKALAFFVAAWLISYLATRFMI